MLDDTTLAELMARDAIRCNARLRRLIGNAGQATTEAHRAGGEARAQAFREMGRELEARVLAVAPRGREFTVREISDELDHDGGEFRSKTSIRQAIERLTRAGHFVHLDHLGPQAAHLWEVV
jgi:hypothetical protein